MIDLQAYKNKIEEFTRKILDELEKSETKNRILRLPESFRDGALNSSHEELIVKE